MPRESKERIKDRMLKTAARLWGYADVEVESSFDPIVKLMLDACSYELEKISGDMEASHSRMIEKMVEVILPDVLVGIRPASTIINALPVDAEYTLHPKKHFTTIKKVVNTVANTTQNFTIHFSPIGNFQLKNGTVKYIASGNKLSQVIAQWQKETILQTEEFSKDTSYWVGLEMKQGIENLKGINFYFDLRNQFQKENFYHHLRQVKCYCNGKEIKLASGMNEEPQFTQLNIDDISDNLFQFNQKICNHIYKIYQKQFLHIESDLPLKELLNNGLPSELVSKFGESSLKEKIKENCIWLKFDFSSSLAMDALENVFCNINCVPMINRKQHELTYKTQKYINVIPIENKDYFFDIKSIVGANGVEYHKRNLTTSSELGDGEAILRASGVGRFDSREAKETIGYLLQIIRDETSTFSEIGGEAVAVKMKELNQVLSRLEDQMRRFQHTGSSCYIMLKPKKEMETVFIEYWTSNGKNGNDIRIGTKLIQESGSELQSNGVVMLSTSMGGKDKLNLEEKLNLFRKYLLAKDRIITAEDIKILAFQLIGQNLKQVIVRKGVMTGYAENVGYVRCIDVVLSFKNKSQYQSDELSYMVNDLMIRLEESSSSLFPYRIIID